MQNPFTLIKSESPKKSRDLERVECSKHGVVLYGIEVVMTPYKQKGSKRWDRRSPTKKVLICPECHKNGVFTEIAE